MYLLARPTFTLLQLSPPRLLSRFLTPAGDYDKLKASFIFFQSALRDCLQMKDESSYDVEEMKETLDNLKLFIEKLVTRRFLSLSFAIR